MRVHPVDTSPGMGRLLHGEAARDRILGVRQVRARALDQRIHVLFDPAVLDGIALAARLDAGGYQTKVIG